jgi:CBS domain-containing protein
MRVSGFMIPAEKVVTVSPTNSVHKVLDLILEHNIGAVVVIQHEDKKKDAGDDGERGRLCPCLLASLPNLIFSRPTVLV